MSELHIYGTRPALPSDKPSATRGRPHTFRRDGRDFWRLAVYPATPPYALDALLFHAERRTLIWQGQGWADTFPPGGLTHELWHCDDHAQPRVALVRITETTLTAARGFINLLAHRSLDTAVTTYLANLKTLNAPTAHRLPTLQRITEDSEHLVPAQGTP